jgi:hypothetical protein
MGTAEESPAAATRRWWPARTVRTRLAIAAFLLVVVGGGGFVWWGNPQLSEGGSVGPGDGMSWANDGIEDTRMVVRGRPVGTVTATFSIYNDGHLPLTVHGLDVTEMIDWLARQQVTFVRGIPGWGNTAAAQKEVTLGPGEEATIFWSLPMACQPTLGEGSSMSITSLRFRVSWLGIPATREVRLERPVTFVTDDVSHPPPGADCDSD